MNKCYIPDRISEKTLIQKMFDPVRCEELNCPDYSFVGYTSPVTTKHSCFRFEFPMDYPKRLSKRASFNELALKCYKENPNLFREDLIDLILEEIDKEMQRREKLYNKRRSEVIYKFHEWFMKDNKICSGDIPFSSKEEARRAIIETCMDDYAEIIDWRPIRLRINPEVSSLLKKGVELSGSVESLGKKIKIPKSTIRLYVRGKFKTIPAQKFGNLVAFLRSKNVDMELDKAVEEVFLSREESQKTLVDYEKVVQKTKRTLKKRYGDEKENLKRGWGALEKKYGPDFRRVLAMKSVEVQGKESIKERLQEGLQRKLGPECYKIAALKRFKVMEKKHGKGWVRKSLVKGMIEKYGPDYARKVGERGTQMLSLMYGPKFGRVILAKRYYSDQFEGIKDRLGVYDLTDLMSILINIGGYKAVDVFLELFRGEDLFFENVVEKSKVPHSEAKVIVNDLLNKGLAVLDEDSQIKISHDLYPTIKQDKIERLNELRRKVKTLEEATSRNYCPYELVTYDISSKVCPTCGKELKPINEKELVLLNEYLNRLEKKMVDN